MNSLLKYPGVKWSIANWIISHFPEHHSYLEAFVINIRSEQKTVAAWNRRVSDG